jgi:hypothetical protein
MSGGYRILDMWVEAAALAQTMSIQWDKSRRTKISREILRPFARLRTPARIRKLLHAFNGMTHEEGPDPWAPYFGATLAHTSTTHKR